LFRDLGDAVCRSVDQEHSIAAFAGEAFDKFGFVDEQAALEDGIGDRGYYPKFERAAMFVGIINRIADFFVKGPFERVGIANGGNFSDFFRPTDTPAAQ